MFLKPSADKGKKMNKFFNSPMVSFVLGVFVILSVMDYAHSIAPPLSKDTPLFQLQTFVLFWNGLVGKMVGPWFLGNGIRGLIIQANQEVKNKD